MNSYQDVIREKKKILESLECHIPGHRRVFKRLFDIVFSFLGLIALSPILLIVAIWIKISTKENVFYKQKRMGKNLELFDIYKFQTMVPNADKMGPLVTVGEDPRVTKPGKFLRKYKIDELPQLFNVLKGDMSFVGPRPEVPKYLKYYTDEQLKLFFIRPGITDLSSIEFKNEEQYLEKHSHVEMFYEDVLLPKKLESSLSYLSNVSVEEDIKTIFKTLFYIIGGK